MAMLGWAPFPTCCIRQQSVIISSLGEPNLFYLRGFVCGYLTSSSSLSVIKFLSEQVSSDCFSLELQVSLLLASPAFYVVLQFTKVDIWFVVVGDKKNFFFSQKVLEV